MWKILVKVAIQNSCPITALQHLHLSPSTHTHLPTVLVLHWKWGRYCGIGDPDTMNQCSTTAAYIGTVDSNLHQCWFGGGFSGFPAKSAVHAASLIDTSCTRIGTAEKQYPSTRFLFLEEQPLRATSPFIWAEVYLYS